jgi:hypothetical protein
MHESILTRGDVQGNKDLLDLIMVKENCVLVHPDRCHGRAATREGQLICIEHLIKHEGYALIVSWLDAIEERFANGGSIHAARSVVSEIHRRSESNAQ